MRLIILLGTLAIALPFLILSAALPFGNAVSNRFLERPTHKSSPSYTIPRETKVGEPLDEPSLISWVGENNGFARGYATRVIPLDILYLFFLGSFLAIASTTLAPLIRWPFVLSGFPAWVWWLLPASYVASDFTEDILIFVLLRWPATIQGATMDVLAFVRGAKILTVTLSIVQVLLLCLASFVPVLRSDP
jgi:hypothetical protein